MTAALVIFVATYLVIASRELRFLGLDRPAGALVGAVAMVALGGLPLSAALGAIDLHVIVLLFGVLLIAAYLHEAGFFAAAAHQVLVRARSARGLLVGLTFVAGALSALLLNDTVCIVLTPIVIAVTAEAKLPALPYLLALASAANVGGVVSFTGNPQNMIVGAAAHGTIGFAQYVALTLPIGIACLAADGWLLAWLFRAQLPREPLPASTAPPPPLDRRLAAKALVALAAFLVLAVAGVALEGAAMCAVAALVVVARTPPRNAFAQVDWGLLVFFAGLFVVVAGIAHTGVLDRLFDAAKPWFGGGELGAYVAFIVIVVVASNLVSNVPLVVIAVAWVPHLPHPVWGYVTLAVVSTLAGNLTIFGSVANVIVLERAGKHGEIGFWQFARYGAVLTLVQLALALGILVLEQAIGVPGWLGL